MFWLSDVNACEAVSVRIVKALRCLPNFRQWIIQQTNYNNQIRAKKRASNACAHMRTRGDCEFKSAKDATTNYKENSTIVSECEASLIAIVARADIRDKKIEVKPTE